MKPLFVLVRYDLPKHSTDLNTFSPLEKLNQGEGLYVLLPEPRSCYYILTTIATGKVSAIC